MLKSYQRCSRHFIALLFVSTISCTSIAEKGDSSDKYYAVTEITDGDTFWITTGPNEREKIRLIGVDAPETRNSSKKKIGYFGKEAKGYLSWLLKGEKVKLKYDAGRKDRFGRTLAYVYLKDGTFVNAELIKNGYAVVLTIPPNVKFSEQFVTLQREARVNNRGLWAQPNGE